MQKSGGREEDSDSGQWANSDAARKRYGPFRNEETSEEPELGQLSESPSQGTGRQPRKTSVVRLLPRKNDAQKTPSAGTSKSRRSF
jgi:hypothetical protein